MTKLELGAVLDWATPEDWEVSSQVTSEADFQEGMDYITAKRLRLAHSMAQAEMLARGVVDVGPEWESEPEYVDFKSVPFTPFLSAGNHAYYENKGWRERTGTGLSMRDANFSWDILLKRQLTIMGLVYPGYNKHDDVVYRMAEHDGKSQFYKYGYDPFERAYEDSKELTDSGYPVRFMTDGILYVKNAPIELESLQRWLDMIEAGDTDVPQTSLAKNWQMVIDSRRQDFDRQAVQTYDDVVGNFYGSPGVFHAPYLAPEVKANGHYFTTDDIWSAGRRLGREEHTLWRDFKSIIKAAIVSSSDRAFETFYSEDVAEKKDGLYILHCSAVLRAIDYLELLKTKANDRVATLAREMAANCLRQRTYDEIADRVAF